MSKKIPDQFEKPESAYDTYVERTSNNGKTSVERFEKYKETEMKNYGIRLDERDKRRFETYWKKRGMTFSQGVRTVIKDFMERQGI